MHPYLSLKLSSRGVIEFITWTRPGISKGISLLDYPPRISLNLVLRAVISNRRLALRVLRVILSDLDLAIRQCAFDILKRIGAIA